MKRHHLENELPALVVDSTMGKLAKWLRLAGLDTLAEKAPPDAIRLGQISNREGRIILTRCRAVYEKCGSNRCVFIDFNSPLRQARQVIRHFKLKRHCLNPLTRCIKCNMVLLHQPKETLQGVVPDHVWHHHERFSVCRGCGRVYWPGTHAQRVMVLVDQWFREQRSIEYRTRNRRWPK